jgi:hypothetical protein
MNKFLVFVLSCLIVWTCFAAWEGDGSSSSIVSGDVDCPDAFTISAWIRPVYNSTYSTNYIVIKGSFGGSHVAYSFYLYQDSGTKTSLRVITYDGSLWGTYYGTASSITLGKWTHVAVTYSNATDDADFYINGSFYETKSDADNMASNNANLSIGGNSGDANNYFQGKIEDLQIYSSVLSAAQIARIYSSRMRYYTEQEGLDPDLYVPLDDGEDGSAANGETAKDRSGNGYDGTCTNGTWVAGSTLSYP